MRPTLSGALLGLFVLGNAYAGTPNADLEIGVSVSPPTFHPGSGATITMTLTNHGPGVAGIGNENFPIFVVQRGFRVPNISRRDLPYDVYDLPIGCNVITELVGPGPPPDFAFELVWSFYFQRIAPGETRTCTMPIVFNHTPFPSFDTDWLAYPVPEDPDLSNNVAAFRFVAGAPPAAIPVPALSIYGLFFMALSLGLTAKRRLHGGSAPR